MTLSVHNPDELIAVIPHLLGFQPEESLVFLPMRSDLPAARVDMPTTARDRDTVWHSISSAFVRYAQPGASVGIVCITDDRAMAETVGPEFAARLDAIGIDTRLIVWADDTRWADINTGDTGLQTEAARVRIAAATVLTGKAQPAPSRTSLGASLVGDREPIAHLLPQAREAANESTPAADARWTLSRVQRFHRDGVRLSDSDAARLRHHPSPIRTDHNPPYPLVTLHLRSALPLGQLALSQVQVSQAGRALSRSHPHTHPTSRETPGLARANPGLQGHRRNRQDLWIGVSCDLLITSGLVA